MEAWVSAILLTDRLRHYNYYVNAKRGLDACNFLDGPPPTLQLVR